MSEVHWIIFGIFSFAGAVQDLKSRTISVWSCLAAGSAAVLAFLVQARTWQPTIVSVLAGMGVGAAMLGAAKFSRGAAGEGDGLFFLTAGLCLGGRRTVCLLFYSLFACGICGAALILKEFVCHGCTEKARKQGLPFLAFVFPVGMWMMYAEIIA